MERETELLKLINVLRRTARMAMQAEWTGGNGNAAAYCAEQYNRVFQRLKELDAGITTLFEPLPSDSSLTVVAMACRHLAAYFEDEVPGGRARAGAFAAAFDPESFKDFWRNAAFDAEDLGEAIRESIEGWARRWSKPCCDEPEASGNENAGPKKEEA